IFINADELDHLLVQQEALLHRNGPWLRIRFWIIDRNFYFEISKGWPAESFGHSRSIGQRIADDIQPTLIDETPRLHHERISVPLSYRGSIPPRFCGGPRQTPSV